MLPPADAVVHRAAAPAGRRARAAPRGYTAPRGTALGRPDRAERGEAASATRWRASSFCDEIVLVDSGSTDRTRAIAEAAGARVIVNAPWPGFVAQRDFAVRAARHDWVLALDADERVGAGAARGDRGAARAAASPTPATASRASPPTSAAGSAATDWYPDWQVRLFDRTRAGWQGDLVHESVARARPGRAPARRHRAPPLRRHRRPPAQDRLLHDAVGAAGARGGPPLEPRRHDRRARPGRSSATTSSSAASCSAARASSSRSSTRTTRSPSSPSCASWGAPAPRGHERCASSTSTPPPPGAAGRTRCSSPRGAWRRAATRPRSPAARAATLEARAARRRARACAPLALPRRPVAARRSSRLARARCGASGRASSLLHDPHARLGRRSSPRASRGRVPLVAVRRVDFPLRGASRGRKYAACDRVIVVSRAIGAVVERGGVPAARLRLVYEGVARPRAGAGRARGARRARRARRGAGGRQRGGAHRPQGPRDARRGDGAPARRALPEARLVIAGEGELRAALEALVRERGLADRVALRRLPRRPRPPAARVLRLLPLVAPRGARHEPPRRDGLRPADRGHRGGRHPGGGRGRRHRARSCRRATPPRSPTRSPRCSATRLRRRRYGEAGRRRFLERFTDDRMVEETLRVLEEVRVKVRAILNPRAGVAAAGRGRRSSADAPAGRTSPCRLTGGRATPTELAREAVAGGADVVVAVGGDGTVNEVARRRSSARRAALGIVPGRAPATGSRAPCGSRCGPSARSTALETGGRRRDGRRPARTAGRS